MSLLDKQAAMRDICRDHPGEPFDEGAYEKIERQPVAFAVETYRQAQPGIADLLPAHWEEIALDKDAIKLDVDWANYAWLAEQGMLHIVTARDGNVLVGYHISIIRPHAHYKGSLTCFSDIMYLKPEYRAGMTGYKLIRFFRDSVKAKGVQKIYMMTKLTLDLDPILRRLGFKAIERVYTQVFQ
ncbi:MAG: GNAT family protein [Steroidobacteraceae bacterium]